jgi:hypothetical protein
MDNLVDSLSFDQPSTYILNPAEREIGSQSLVLWEKPVFSAAPENQTIEFTQNNDTLIEYSSQSQPFEAKKNSRTSKGDDRREFQMMSPTQSKPESPTASLHHKIVGDEEIGMTFVTDVLGPIFSAFQAISSEQSIPFDIIEESSELPGVIAAPKALQEAVSNLLDNAMKYAILPKENSPFSSNPSPRVRVRMLQNIDFSGVTILVEDNGPGIKQEDSEDIFTRGFRGESTNAVEGSGIGLDISQALVKRMGGTLVLADNKSFPNCLDGTVMALTLYRTGS